MNVTTNYVTYAAWRSTHRLRRAHHFPPLRHLHPRGLPAGAICSPPPGRWPRRFRPASTGYYYFVSDSYGSCISPGTYTEHLENIQTAAASTGYVARHHRRGRRGRTSPPPAITGLLRHARSGPRRHGPPAPRSGTAHRKGHRLAVLPEAEAALSPGVTVVMTRTDDRELPRTSAPIWPTPPRRTCF
jgi:hypothetical protein